MKMTMTIKIMKIKIKMLIFKTTQRMKTIFLSLPMTKTKSLINWSSKKEESLKKSTNNLNVTLNVKRSWKNIWEMSINNFWTLKDWLIRKINKQKQKIIYGKSPKDNVEDFKVKLKSTIKLFLKIKKDLMTFKWEFSEQIKKLNK